MINKKALVALLIGLSIITIAYFVSTLALGTPPGLFVPTALFFWAWLIGKFVAEGLNSRDKERWQRTLGAVGVVVSIFVGMSFLVVIHSIPSPLTGAVRVAVDGWFGWIAMTTGTRLATTQ